MFMEFVLFVDKISKRMEELLYKQESYDIVGAIIAVSKELCCGFVEKVYQEALEYEFKERGIPYEREKEIEVVYKGHPLGEIFRPDFICYGKIIVELKAATALEGWHRSQVINYLHIAKMKLGLLVNFGEPMARIERIVSS